MVSFVLATRRGLWQYYRYVLALYSLQEGLLSIPTGLSYSLIIDILAERELLTESFLLAQFFCRRRAFTILAADHF